MRQSVSNRHGVAKIEKAAKSGRVEKVEKAPKPKEKRRKLTPQEAKLQKQALHKARVEAKAMEIMQSSGHDFNKTVYGGEMAYLRAELAVTQEEMTKPERARVRAEQRQAALIKDADMSRAMRNEQRNIGRDIKATYREMGKLDPDSREYQNLQERAKRLEVLRFEMRASNVVDGDRRYNSVSTRVHAFEEYVTKYGGRSKLEEQRNEVVNLSYSFGQETFLHRIQNYYKEAFKEIEDPDGLFERTPTYERLQWEMEQAVREFDYETVLDTVSRLSHGKKEFYSKHASPKRYSARDVR